MNSKQLLKLALKLPDVTLKDHFGSDAISANGRNFVTIWHDEGKANLRVSPADQKALLESDEEVFAEIDNAWGRQGWTSMNIQYVTPETALRALKVAWEYSKQKSVPFPKRKVKSKK